MWIERTSYYAKPGRAAAVLDARRQALGGAGDNRTAGRCDFCPRGRRRAHVRWECGFESSEAHAADLAARAGSEEFEAARAHMRSLIDRFERIVERRDTVSPLPSGMVDRALHGQAMVPIQKEFRSGNHLLKGYLFLPPDGGPFPCMVLNHGSGIDRGTLDVSRPGTASLLASWGIASFLPHRQGYGNSEGTPWREEVFSTFGTAEYDAQLAARLDRESDDVLAAAKVAAALPEVRADHVGVMGSSFGGVNTLLAAAKSKSFRCAVEFAGAAMNWDRTPGLRQMMTEAALRLTIPIYFIQAANDYSIRPTQELAEVLRNSNVVHQAKIFPPFGITPHEGHLFERDGAQFWAPEVRRFLERHL